MGGPQPPGVQSHGHICLASCHASRHIDMGRLDVASAYNDARLRSRGGLRMLLGGGGGGGVPSRACRSLGLSLPDVDIDDVPPGGDWSTNEMPSGGDGTIDDLPTGGDWRADDLASCADDCIVSRITVGPIFLEFPCR